MSLLLAVEFGPEQERRVMFRVPTINDGLVWQVGPNKRRLRNAVRLSCVSRYGSLVQWTGTA